MKATLSHRLEYAALRAALAVVHLLPFEVARRFGARLGRLGYFPLGIRRRVVEAQIAAAFPDLPETDIARLSRGAYAHLGRTSIETALTSFSGREAVLRMFEESPDFAIVERAFAQGQGVAVVAGHIGNWELCGAYVGSRGIPIDVIVRRMSNPLFDAFLNRTRERNGMTVVYDADAVRRTPRAFKEGRVVGFMSDQGVKGLASTFVPFFGRPAKTPRGAAVFGLRFKVPMIFIAAMLQPNGKYRFVAEQLALVDTGNKEQDVDAMVLQYTQVIERLVRQYPEQYFWQHRRWRRQPADTPLSLREPT